MTTKSLRNKLLVVVTLLSFIFSSCNHDEVYYRYNEIKDGEWGKNDTLFFNIDSIENGIYDINVDISNNINYPYQNIWLLIQNNLADSTFQERVLELQIADKGGNWLGDGFGSLYQLSIPLRSKSKLDSVQGKQIKIVHNMKDDVLVGIERVGIRISK